MVTPLRIGALFAGYGGLDMAVESVLDAEVSWVSEFDAHPSRILAHRYPHAPNLGDVTKIDWSAVEPVDVITGGSPCQDLSHAGKRAGMKSGTRSGLWASMCDAIDIIRPRLVLWENVRGALSAEATAGDVESCELCVGDERGPSLRALGRVLGDLAEIGYDAAWTGLRAADVGAPHGRWRVFVLAWPAADTAGARRGEGEVRRAGGGDAGAWAWGGEPQRDGGEPARPGVEPPLLPTPAVNDMGASYTPETWDEWTERMRSEHGNGNGHGKSLHIEALRLLPTPEAKLGSSGPDYARAARPGAGGDSLHEAVGRLAGDAIARQPERWGEYAPAIARWEALTRPAPDPAEPTGKGGAHRLSPRFAEWLMGLPDGWVTDPAIWEGVKPSTARNAQLKALGNGVVPQQAATALRWLLGVRSAALDLPLEGSDDERRD